MRKSKKRKDNLEGHSMLYFASRRLKNIFTCIFREIIRYLQEAVLQSF